MARSMFFSWLFVLASMMSLVATWDINKASDRAECQAFNKKNPLDGCDHSRTLVVDSNSHNSKFKTVQSAVASLPNNTDTYIILITEGNYTEQVNVTRQGPTYLLGQTAEPTTQASNTVNIIWAAIAIPPPQTTGVDNAFTSTLTVAPTLDADLTGAGPTGFAVPNGTAFGSSDFRSYNLNFINDFAPFSDSPSLAISLGYANCGFYYSGFFSYQDTVYVGKLANAYFKHSVIAGQTDFFYGFGTAWIQSSDIRLRSCGGGITAWKGTNTTFENKYGIYIVDSNVRAANESIAPQIVGRCALGRPWNDGMRSIFVRTFLDASIIPTGFIDWSPPRYDNNTFQAEFQNFGPGFNATARATAQFDVQLSAAQYEPFSTPQKVFQTPKGKFGEVAWIDFDA